MAIVWQHSGKLFTTNMTESKLQTDCFKWAWNERPETRGLLCYNLNNSRNRIDGARNKALGLIAGRSDMVLYWQGRAVMLEFKQPGGIQSRKQKEWEQLVRAHGFDYHIIKDFNQFKEVVQNELD